MWNPAKRTRSKHLGIFYHQPGVHNRIITLVFKATWSFPNPGFGYPSFRIHFTVFEIFLKQWFFFIFQSCGTERGHDSALPLVRTGTDVVCSTRLSRNWAKIGEFYIDLRERYREKEGCRSSSKHWFLESAANAGRLFRWTTWVALQRQRTVERRGDRDASGAKHRCSNPELKKRGTERRTFSPRQREKKKMDLFEWLLGCLLTFLWSSSVRGEGGGKFDVFLPPESVNCKSTIVKFLMRLTPNSFKRKKNPILYQTKCVNLKKKILWERYLNAVISLIRALGSGLFSKKTFSSNKLPLTDLAS